MSCGVERFLWKVINDALFAYRMESNAGSAGRARLGGPSEPASGYISSAMLGGHSIDDIPSSQAALCVYQLTPATGQVPVEGDQRRPLCRRHAFVQLCLAYKKILLPLVVLGGGRFLMGEAPL